MSTAEIEDVKRRMDGAIEALKREFAGLRTGRASAGLLDPVRVDAYGASVPLSQVGTVGVPEPRLLTVQVWDRSMVGAVERAIRDSDLGLNPSSDGQLVRVPIPELSEERRRELVKVAGRYAEQAKVAVRNVRRDAMDVLKRMEKDGEIGQDVHKNRADQIQKLTDAHVKDIDATTAAKEKEIMQV
jgi:ribosome recycling factor